MAVAAYCLVAPAALCAAVPHHPIIGYGSSNSVYSTNIVEAFYSGFESGLVETLGRERMNDILTKSLDLSGSPVGAIHAVESLIDQKVEVLVGFPGSHDCILAGQIAKSKDIPAIFLNCSHSKLATLGDNIFSTESSMELEVEAMLHFLAYKFKSGTGLIIINQKAAASIDQEPIYRRLLDGRTLPVNAEVHRLNDGLVLDDALLSEIKGGKFQYIVLTAYPDSLLNLRDQMISERINLPLVGSSPWDNPDSMRRFIANLKTPFYFSSTWNRGLPISQEFIRKFKAHFHKEPDAEEAFGYDLGSIVGRTVKKAKQPLDRNTFLDAFHAQKCFSDLNAVTLCFNKNGGYTNRTRYFTQMTDSGYKILFTYAKGTSGTTN